MHSCHLHGPNRGLARGGRRRADAGGSPRENLTDTLIHTTHKTAARALPLCSTSSMEAAGQATVIEPFGVRAQAFRPGDAALCRSRSLMPRPRESVPSATSEAGEVDTGVHACHHADRERSMMMMMMTFAAEESRDDLAASSRVRGCEAPRRRSRKVESNLTAGHPATPAAAAPSLLPPRDVCKLPPHNVPECLEAEPAWRGEQHVRLPILHHETHSLSPHLFPPLAVVQTTSLDPAQVRLGSVCACGLWDGFSRMPLPADNS